MGQELMKSLMEQLEERDKKREEAWAEQLRQLEERVSGKGGSQHHSGSPFRKKRQTAEEQAAELHAAQREAEMQEWESEQRALQQQLQDQQQQQQQQQQLQAWGQQQPSQPQQWQGWNPNWVQAQDWQQAGRDR